MWHRPGGSLAAIQLSQLFLCCLNHRSSDSRAFQSAGQPPKLSLTLGDLNRHLTHGSLDLNKSAPQTACRSVQPLLQGSWTWPTDRQTQTQTDRRRYSVSSNRSMSLDVAAMRPKKKWHFLRTVQSVGGCTILSPIIFTPAIMKSDG